MRYGSPRPRRSCRKVDDGAARTASKKGLLPKEAYVVLRTYFTQTTQHPNNSQIAKLIEDLRRIPGCEDCKAQKLQAYFKERRKTVSRARMAARFKASRYVEPEIIEVEVASPPISAPSSAADDPDEPQLPRPSMPNPHLHTPFPSLLPTAPKTFADFAKWLQELNLRWMNLVTL